MAVKELRIVEVRCDRCELLIAKRQLGADDEVLSETKQAKNTGSFVLCSTDDAGSDTELVAYDVVCDRCRVLLEGLIKKMGKVNRGTRKRSKKVVEKSKPVETTSVEKEATPKKTPKKKK